MTTTMAMPSATNPTHQLHHQTIIDTPVNIAIRRALLSVSNKEGLLDLALALQQRGVELLSTGGTATLLEQQGIAVKQVAAHTGFPEIMDGRVKTLHPKIHGGLL